MIWDREQSLRKASLVWLSAVVVMFAAVLAPPAGVNAQPAGFLNAPTYSATGVGYVVFQGGSLDELSAAAAAVGAASAWAQDTSGTFLAFTVDGPSFVNNAFRNAFGSGFSGPTAIVLVRSTKPASTGGTTTPAPAPAVGSWTSVDAPAIAPSWADEWIGVAGPGGTTMLASVLRPEGAGPFPAVVLLHSQSGFTVQYLELGREIAGSGFVVVVGCWFAGNYDGTSSSDNPATVNDPEGIACPDGPALKPVTSTAAVDDIAALITATKTIEEVDAQRVGLVGNSRGSIAGVLTAALQPNSIDAVVAIGGAPLGGALLASQITAPVLLLQGAEDSVVPVSYAQQLEQGLNALGRVVESHYYAGAGHGILFDTPYTPYVMARLYAFLHAQLD